MLVEVTERAMAHCNANEVLIVGGVGCTYICYLFVLPRCCVLSVRSCLLENIFVVIHVLRLCIC